MWMSPFNNIFQKCQSPPPHAVRSSGPGAAVNQQGKLQHQPVSTDQEITLNLLLTFDALPSSSSSKINFVVIPEIVGMFEAAGSCNR